MPKPVRPKSSPRLQAPLDDAVVDSLPYGLVVVQAENPRKTRQLVAPPPHPQPLSPGGERGEMRPPPRSGEIYLYDDLEIPLIEVLAQMEFTGIRLDVPLLHKMSADMDG